METLESSAKSCRVPVTMLYVQHNYQLKHWQTITWITSWIDQKTCNTGLFPSLLISLSIWPVSIKPNILKSHKRDQNGCLNVSGVFPSIKKWLYQANPYPKTGANKINHHLKRTAMIIKKIEIIVPMKCQRRVDAFECWLT